MRQPGSRGEGLTVNRWASSKGGLGSGRPSRLTASMREVSFSGGESPEAATFVACLATILELPPEDLPAPSVEADGVDWGMRRWLGGLGLGLVPVEHADSFSWAGPWIGWARLPDGEQRAVVMFAHAAGS